MLSESKGSLISPFPICIHFISFYCLIILAKTLITFLNRSGKRAYPWLVSDFSIDVVIFSPLIVMLTVGFLEMFFIKWGNSPLHLLNIFIINGSDLTKYLFMMDWLYELIFRYRINLNTWNKSHLVVICTSIFIHCYDQLAKFFWGF